MRLVLVLGCLLAASGHSHGRADELAADQILDRPRPFVIESFRVRYTHFDQDGRGLQSRADRARLFSPGLETATVDQPQAEIIARQGRFTHRLWVPVDVITAASPDAINGWPPPDAVSQASRRNESGSIDLSTTWHRDADTDIAVRAAFHLEEPFRSWLLGVGIARAFAEQNTVVSASFNQVLDWLDRFDFDGSRAGRDFRSTSNANLGVTQLLSPTTVAHLEYGATVQLGELSNTWNAVALSTGLLDRERLPRLRHRHAFAGRLAQALPWNGVAKGMVRFYVDDWGIVASTVELQLYQRFARWFWLRLNYRWHQQTAPPFWTVSADPQATYRTSDSDLAAFSAHAFGILAAADLPFVRRLRGLHVDVGYELYSRTNGLRANIYTCSLGFRF